MAAILLVAPAVEPLTLAEAKHFLRVEHDDDDDLIASLIKGARGHIEARMRRVLIAQTWRVILDAWPRDGRIVLALAPLLQVAAARVYDSSGVVHAVDTDAFVIDPAAAPGIIGFPLWAVGAPGRPLAGIELDVEAGYGPSGADVPEPLRQAVRVLLAHWYEHRGVATAEGLTPLPAALDAITAAYRVLTL